MSWIQKLYETYDSCQSSIGDSNDEKPLLPICHTTQKAHIEIFLSIDGIFLRANTIHEEERTIIPATEDSAGRTSGTSPHPLCDKLQYVAEEYSYFGGDKEPCFYFSGKEFKRDKLKIDEETFIQEYEKSNLLLIKELFQKKKKPFDVINSLIKISNLDELLSNNKGTTDIAEISENPETIRNNKSLIIDFFPKTLSQVVSYSYLLKKWCESNYAHPQVNAVFNYVMKKTVITDLIKAKILHLDTENKKLLNQWTEGKAPDIFKLLPGGYTPKGERKPWQLDAFVRWAVEMPDNAESKLWKSKSVRESWIKHYYQTLDEVDLCYITGKPNYIAYNHPAKIRNDGDKAKIISSNDLTGYTFRGRVTSSKEAVTISYEATQKAHNALRWLIGKQGFRNGDQSFVAWAVSGLSIPDPFADTLGLFSDAEIDLEESTSTAQEFANSFNKLIAGYSANLSSTNDIIVIGLDSASPGRLAIIFYRELTSSDFLERIQTWHSSSAWMQDYGLDFKSKKSIRFIGAASPKDVAETAFGMLKGENKSKIVKATIERILPCIVDGNKIPFDIVKSCIQRVSNRVSFEKKWEWDKALGIACSVIKNYYRERGYSMSLEKDRTTRDYLYGRLLAIADRLESHALYEAGENRETNVARLMQRFSDQPFTTWKIIEESLTSYKARLHGANFYQSLLDEVMSLFKTEDFTNNSKLTGEYLLGYHCQRKVLEPKKKNQNNDSDSNDGSNETKGE